MKNYILKVFIFFTPGILFLSFGILAPTTPRASKSLLMSSIYKDSLLQNIPTPRIIFIGGSNLSFGLNSQTIKDSLKLNPINTAIHASIGIKYMIDNSIEYIQKGDILVLIPEYSHFYRSLNNGSVELMRMVLDVNLSNIKHLNFYQIANITPLFPEYCLSKFRKKEYFNVRENRIYSVNSFNQYGDTYTHWDMKPRKVSPTTITGTFNHNVIKYIERYEDIINSKGATLLVSYPSFQATSYERSTKRIMEIQTELKKANFLLLGSPLRYKMADSLMFNTFYHLNKNGVDLRTNLIIEDIKKTLIQGN